MRLSYQPRLDQISSDYLVRNLILGELRGPRQIHEYRGNESFTQHTQKAIDSSVYTRGE